MVRFQVFKVASMKMTVDRPDDGGGKRLGNIDEHLLEHTAQQPRRRSSSVWKRFGSHKNDDAQFTHVFGQRKIEWVLEIGDRSQTTRTVRAPTVHRCWTYSVFFVFLTYYCWSLSINRCMCLQTFCSGGQASRHWFESSLRASHKTFVVKYSGLVLYVRALHFLT